MPELPEVALAGEQLRAWVEGVEAVEVRDPRAVKGAAGDFAAALEGRRVTAVERIGKHLIARMEDHAWWIHLGMSGRLARRAAAEELPKATRWAVRSGGHWMGLVDPRVFGRTAAGERSWVLGVAQIEGLGPDALAIDPATLGERLAGTRRAVKVALMDQALIAGLGNIQVAEALFRAGIHPRRPARTLDEGEVAALWTGVHGTLEDTLDDLRTEADERGEVTYMSDGGGNPFSVYGREGEPCVRCGGAIARMVQGGRGTYFCPRCQPERGK